VEDRQKAFKPQKDLQWPETWLDKVERFPIKNPSVGVARQEFLPSRPTSLAGFGGIWRRFTFPHLGTGGTSGFNAVFCKPYQSVEHAPRLKVRWWQNQIFANEPPQVFLEINLDLVAVSSDVTLRLQQKIREEFPELTPERILIQATHTHSGPAGLSTQSALGLFACDAYQNDLFLEYSQTLLQTIQKAKQSLQPVDSWKHQAGLLPDFVKSRNPKIDSADQYDRLLFQTKSKEVSCSHIQGVHPIFYGQKDLILSGDLARTLEDSWDPHQETCFFSVGTGGNTVVSSLSDDSSVYSNQLTEEIIKQHSSIEDAWKPLTDDWQYGITKVKLLKPQINLKGCKVKSPIESTNLPSFFNPYQVGIPEFSVISAQKINDLFIVYLPIELTSSLAVEWKSVILERIPGVKEVLFVTLSMDYLGYFVTEPIYQSSSLESCSSVFPSKINQIFLDRIVFLIQSMQSPIN